MDSENQPSYAKRNKTMQTKIIAKPEGTGYLSSVYATRPGLVVEALNRLIMQQAENVMKTETYKHNYDFTVLKYTRKFCTDCQQH